MNASRVRKKNGGPKPAVAKDVRLKPDPHLEVCGQTQKDEPAEGVVHLRERVAVAEQGGAGVLTDERWILVENVVDAHSRIHAGERSELAGVVRAGQVEVAARAKVLVGLDDVGRQTRIRAGAIVVDR